MKFKFLSLLIIVAVSTSAIAQENFSVKNTMIQWQLVFENAPKTLDKHLKKSGFLTTKQPEEIQFSREFTTDELKKFDFVRATFPPYVNNGTITGVINLQENRYRVNITNIKVLNDSDDNYYNLEDHVVRKGNIKPQPQHIKTLNMLNEYFISLFTISDDKDDW